MKDNLLSDATPSPSRSDWPEIASFVADVLPKYVNFQWGEASPYKAEFKKWQQAGLTILPNHPYMAVPDLSILTPSELSRPVSMHGIDMRDAAQLELLETLAQFRSEYMLFARRTEPAHRQFHFGGDFGRVDGEFLYALLRWICPRNIFQVGSGFPTLLMAEACARIAEEGGQTNLKSIDPTPNDFGAMNLPLFEQLPSRLEEFPQAFWSGLESNDVLFIDSSHVLKVCSDVEYLFFEVIPNLNVGVYVHIHDIFLPDPYPPNWLEEEHVFWNEQYLLASFLAFNESFEVVLANSYMASKYPDKIRATIDCLPDGKLYPGSFWIRRIK